VGAVNVGMENAVDVAQVMQDSFDCGFTDSDHGPGNESDDKDDGGDEETDDDPVKDSMEIDTLGE